ncbi:MAG: rhomboid family intramembrane serine protease [Elainellaceae cyanobacterium]
MSEISQIFLALSIAMFGFAVLNGLDEKIKSPSLRYPLIAIIAIGLIISFSMIFEQDWKVHARLLLKLVLFAWSIHVVNWAVLRGSLSHNLGIQPRKPQGLIGVICAPFLHGGGEDHVLGNTWVFILLGWLILIQINAEYFVFVTIVIALISGFGTWIFGNKDSRHVGASGLVFGYLGFVLSFAVLNKNFAAVLFALLVTRAYVNTIKMLFPGQTGEGISWEMHLFGFVGGIVAANLIFRQPEFVQTLFNEQVPQWIWPDSMHIQ